MNLKNKKGITLIALVITIIILLILAGITIVALTGDNGIIKQANDAKNKTKQSEVKEALELSVLTSRINEPEIGSIDIEKLKEELEKLKENKTIDSYKEENEKQDILFTAEKDKCLFEISKDGKITVKENTITISNVTVKDGTTILKENCKSIELKTPLTISFEVGITNGTIEEVVPKETFVFPNVVYTTNGELEVTFTINGKDKDGNVISRDYSLNLRGYYNIPEPKVGDYIDYKPSVANNYNNLTAVNTGSSNNSTSIAQETLKWQILRIYDNGSMDLVGSPTHTTVYFGNAIGYNNGVYLMNDICEKLYSRGNIKARSINVEDIDKWLEESEEGVATRAAALSIFSGNIKYSNSKTYSISNSLYPVIYEKENGSGIDTTELKQDGITDFDSYYRENTLITNNAYKQASKSGLTVKQTAYQIDVNSNNYGDGAKVIRKGTYWLASRCVNCYGSYAGFGLRQIGAITTFGRMFDSYNGAYTNYNSSLRPVVTLGEDVKIDISNNATNSNTPHEIVQY